MTVCDGIRAPYFWHGVTIRLCIDILVKNHFTYYWEMFLFYSCFWTLFDYQLFVLFQIIPVQTIIDTKDRLDQFQLLKNIAFSVYTSCRLNITHSVLGRSLTGFGPAAGAEAFLKKSVSTDLCLSFHVHKISSYFKLSLS